MSDLKCKRAVARRRIGKTYRRDSNFVDKCSNERLGD